MANKKKYEHAKQTPVIVEKEEYETFVNSLPRTKTFNDAINEYIKSVNLERKKEEALNSLDYSAVTVTNNNIQTKLDKYFPNHLRDWQSFKNVVENELSDDERIQATEMLYSNLRMLEMINYKKGKKHYPFLKI